MSSDVNKGSSGLNSKATTKQQYQVMLDFMKENGDLSTHPCGRVQTRLLWHKLTDKLNECPGSPKHYKSWVKIWSDWKTRVKKKVLTIQFDDGKASALTLTECQLVVFLGYNVVVKDGTSETGLKDIKSLFHESKNSSYVPQEIEEVIIKSETSDPECHKLDNNNITNIQQEGKLDEDDEMYTDYEALEQTDGELETIQEPPAKKKRRFLQKQKKTPKKQEQPSISSLDSIVDKFAALENRRIELELLREQNESRRISAQIQSNATQQQFIDFMQFMRGAITSFLTIYRSQTLSNEHS